jgi:flavin-binding protein dodecin
MNVWRADDLLRVELKDRLRSGGHTSILAFDVHARRRMEMSDHIYKVVEIVGSSATSIEDAVQRAITRASKTIREIRWFEIVTTRGNVEDGKVAHYQVTLRIGFTLDG